jgi:hypothetical protein
MAQPARSDVPKSSYSATASSRTITEVDFDTHAIVKDRANDENHVKRIKTVRNMIGFTKACMSDYSNYEIR